MILRFVPIVLSLLLQLGIADTSATDRLTLQNLEKAIVSSPDVRLADAYIEAQRAAVVHEEALDGPEFFGSMGIGRYKDLVDEDSIWYHTGGRFIGGITLPLLGSKEEKELAVLKAHGTLEEKKLAKKRVIRDNLTALRIHYIDYWASKKIASVCRLFLATRQETMRLVATRRQAALLTDSSTLEIEAQFSKVALLLRKSLGTSRSSLGWLSMLTAKKLQPFTPYRPNLPWPKIDDPGFVAHVVDESPSIKIYRSRLRRSIEMADLQKYKDIASDIRLVGHIDPEYDSHREGTGIALSFNVKIPFSVMQAMESTKKMEAIEIQKSLLALNKRIETVKIEAYDAIDAMKRSIEAYRYERARYEKALATLKEQRLGEGKLSRVTPETLQKARYQYLLASVDLIDAYAGKERAKARVLGLLEQEAKEMVIVDDEGFVPSITQPLAVSARHHSPKKAGFYLWRSEPLWRSDDGGARFFENLAKNGFNRIMISLDARILRSLATEEGARKMFEILRNGSRAGIEVDALLGDPHWLLPSQRGELARIVASIGRFPFSSIHLDIEPDQLETGWSPVQKSERLLQTLSSAIGVSSLPIGISLHPRYFDETYVGFDLACRLADLNVHEVAVMLYGRPYPKAVEMLETLRARCPRLPLTLAVSVESDFWPALKIDGQKDFENPPVDLLIQDYTHWRRLVR